MRFVAFALAVVILGAIVSCAADMPVAPGPGAKVTGIVQDREGNPVASVRLYFEPRSSGGSVAYGSAITGPDGTYSVELGEGTYRVQILPPYDRGYPFVTVESFQVSRDGGRFEYRYTGTLVSGTATGPGGSPMATFGVGADAIGSAGWASVEGRNGSYSLLLAPGSYLFTAAAPYGSGAPRYHFEATITEQDTVIDLDFSGSEITVHVSLFGSPVPEVEIGAEGSEVTAYAVTDIDGNARLYLPPGGYTITADTNVRGITGPERRYVEVQGDGTVPFDLSGVRWDATVRRSGDLQPVPQADVYVYEIGGTRWGGAQTDQNGRFTMIVRPGWGHDIRITPAGSLRAYSVNGVASSADSTFDLPIPVPAP
jgi:hypothetical protein